jgi:hypothetical protein
LGNRQVRFVDATAANDPESLALLLAGLRVDQGSAAAASAVNEPGMGNYIAVYNHREDRGTRLRVFAEGCHSFHDAGHLILTGDRPSHSLLRLVRSRRGQRPVRFVTRARLGASLADIVRTQPEIESVVFCGNAKGLDIPDVWCIRG